jgi:1,4-alpha-glucan branching enzyme
MQSDSTQSNNLQSDQASGPAMDPEPWFERDRMQGKTFCTTNLEIWAPFADAVSVRIFSPQSADSPGADEEQSSSSDRGLKAEVDLRGYAGGVWRGTFDSPVGTPYLIRIKAGEEVLDRIDPRGLGVTSSVGKSITQADDFVWSDQDFEPRSLNEWVLYELHPGTFALDLDGAISRLDHLSAIGVTAIEVMPVAEFAGDLSWGYNPALPFAVESSYGGPAAFRRFVDAAHSRGIAVVLDVVYNHLGPSDLDLWRFDGWSENDGGGIYFYNDWKAETPWGATRPDYGREEVKRYLIDNARMWFEQFHVDGLRLDSTINIRNAHGHTGPDGDLPQGWAFLSELVGEIHSSFPRSVIIAEDLQQDLRLTVPQNEGGLGFDLQWSAGFVHPVRAALTAINDEQRELDNVILAVVGETDGSKRVIYTESHDEVANGKTRVPAEVDPDHPESVWAFRRAALGAVLTLTSPGVPMLFQGQEWGDEDYFDDTNALEWSRGNERTGYVAMWRDLIRLRTGSDDRALGLQGDQTRAIRTGDEGQIVVVHRWGIGGPEHATVVVLSFSGRSHEVTVNVPKGPAAWRCVFSSDFSGYHESGTDSTLQLVPVSDDGESLVLSNLAPYSAAIYVSDESVG